MGFKPRFQTLVEIYEKSIVEFADRPLFGTKRAGVWEWMTYREFGRQVDAFRGALASLGIGRGDRIAIVSNNRVEWAVGAFAAYGLGATFVPMYESQSPKDWEFILRDSDAKVLMCACDAVVEKAKSFFGQIPTLAHLISLDQAPTPDDPRVHSYASLISAGASSGTTGKAAPVTKPQKSDIAQLIYTSGTTGNPKGVILTHYNFASNVSAYHEVFPIDFELGSLSFLPWAHSFGQTCELYNAFSRGGWMAVAESVEKILDNLGEVHPTVLFSVPRVFNKLYASVQKQISQKPKPIRDLVHSALRATAKERAGERLNVSELVVVRTADKLVFSKVRARLGGKLKYAMSGGAAIAREVQEFIDSIGISIYEGYGLTETSPVATTNWPGERRIGSVGRAIPGVRIEIDTSHYDARSANGREEGEVVIYGPNVMKGYHNRNEENAAVFTTDGGFRSGDLGYLDASGYLYITGRIKEQYKLENGKYVVPTPLEESLKLSPWIVSVMVYGDNRPYNTALIVPNMDSVKSWAKENGLASAETAALLKNEGLRAQIAKEIEKHSAEFKGFEAVRSFALIAEDFSIENGMLTPSLKLKRRKVIERYSNILNSLYAQAKSAATAAA